MFNDLINASQGSEQRLALGIFSVQGGNGKHRFDRYPFHNHYDFKALERSILV
jgi:hypothetical protein